VRIGYDPGMVTELKIELPMEAIADFCKRWKIREMAVFGSVLRDDFRPDSDIDVLVTFEPDVRIGLFAFARAEMELEELLGRPVDLLTKRGVEESRNPKRRKEILDSSMTVYAA